MLRTLPSLTLGFVVGIAVGYALSSVHIGTDSPAPAESHMHSMLRVDPASPTPTVSIEAERDAKDGYNLHVVTANFRFAPEHVNGEPLQNEGHAHLYVNGAKIARLYGSWFHLPGSALREGDNEISVTLNANDHSEWMTASGHIEATMTLVK